MKTKLFYLMCLFAVFCVKAQVSFGSPYATSVTASTATLNGTVNLNNTYQVGYQISTNADFSGAAIMSQQNTGAGFYNLSYPVTGLAQNTTYYFRFRALSGGNATYSNAGTFTTQSLSPGISNVTTSPITTNSATINYTLSASGGNSTSVVKYGLASNALTNEAVGFSVSANTVQSGNVQISGLTPNTQYFYRIDATNSYGTVSSSGNFTTNQETTPQLIAEYNFNNSSYNNVNGNTPFASNSGTSFVEDRHGNANNAININNTGTTATIQNLPYGSSPRTVSLWVKINTMNTANYLYSYGLVPNSESITINSDVVYYFLPMNAASTTHTTGTWYHYVSTYDGTVSKIYKNGTLLNTSAMSKNTANNSDVFGLGLAMTGDAGYFNGAIDDLKIYNYALSDSQVTDLYNTQTLAVSNFSKTEKITVYPNPVKDVLNINTSANVKRVEIFSLTGALVKESSSSKIDLSQLSAGNYIVKITDDKGNINTQKIIKN